MKHKIALIIFSLCFLFSCQSDDEDIQYIDQVLNIYVKNSAGQDLFNANTTGYFSNVQFLDLLSDRDLSPITGVTILKDINTINYIDYSAGAVRLIKDSVSAADKTYYSNFVMRLTKTENSQTINVDDTLRIEYSWSPTRFQVSKIWKSKQLIFTKSEGQPNIVNIVK